MLDDVTVVVAVQEVDAPRRQQTVTFALGAAYPRVTTLVFLVTWVGPEIVVPVTVIFRVVVRWVPTAA